VRAEVVEIDPKALDGLAMRKRVIVHFGDQPDGPAVNLNVDLPARATSVSSIIPADTRLPRAIGKRSSTLPTAIFSRRRERGYFSFIT
jgi:hypothetical protein